MGLTNWLMHRSMRREAKRIGRLITERYPVVKTQNPSLPEPDILLKIIPDVSRASERLQKHFRACCISVQGLCYMIAMDMGAMKGCMSFRCLQFTRYMDEELAARGFAAQSKETKEAILKELELPTDGWQQWC